MNLSLENIINQKLHKIFNELNLDEKFATVKVSDRPDLSALSVQRRPGSGQTGAKKSAGNRRKLGKMLEADPILQRFQSTDRVLSTCR